MDLDMEYLMACPFEFDGPELYVSLVPCSGGHHPVLTVRTDKHSGRDGLHLPSLATALSQCVQAAYVFTAVEHAQAWEFVRYVADYQAQYEAASVPPLVN